jgi:hypothetical protein
MKIFSSLKSLICTAIFAKIVVVWMWIFILNICMEDTGFKKKFTMFFPTQKQAYFLPLCAMKKKNTAIFT